jgi:carboxypeptidase T
VIKSRCLILGLMSAVLLSTLSGPVCATEAPNNDCSITVVRAWFGDRAQVETYAAHDEPWEVHHDEGWMLVGADAESLELLFELGFDVEIDERRTMEICSPAKRLPDQTEGIPGYSCYRTVEETFQTAQDLVTDFPNLASWIDVGDSWEKTTAGGSAGYDMQVLRLTNTDVPGTPPSGFTGKPRLFITSAIHAREYTTAELMTRFAEYLVNNHGVDADST